jgi:hypothetical protein
MTVTISAPVAGNRTLTWTVTAPSARIIDIGEDAVHHYWDLGWGRHGTYEAPIPWEQITAAEKLVLMNKIIVNALRDASNTYNIDKGVGGMSAAQTAKQIENQTKYNIDPTALK